MKVQNALKSHSEPQHPRQGVQPFPTFKWAKWQEPEHHSSQEHLWYPSRVKVFQSLRFPMLDLSINIPSTGAPGLSIIFCQRCCSSPCESIQSTSLPLLTPVNYKDMRHFGSYFISLLIRSHSIQERWQAIYTATLPPVQGVMLTPGSSWRAPVCHYTPLWYVGRGTQTSAVCTTRNFLLREEEWTHTASRSHHNQQKGCCWIKAVSSSSLGC